MKYKIIPDDVIKNMIEFLDEIQFDAAKDNSPDALHKINFCNWMISELMNGVDGFDSEEDTDEDTDADGNIKGRWDTIDNYRKDIRLDFPEDMSDEEWKKLLSSFDSFIAGWDREYKKSNHKGKAGKNTLKKFMNELRADKDLTPEEKFELYYDEYRNRQKDKEGTSLKQILNKAGIKKPPTGKQTPKK